MTGTNCFLFIVSDGVYKLEIEQKRGFQFQHSQLVNPNTACHFKHSQLQFEHLQLVNQAPTTHQSKRQVLYSPTACQSKHPQPINRIAKLSTRTINMCKLTYTECRNDSCKNIGDVGGLTRCPKRCTVAKMVLVTFLTKVSDRRQCEHCAEQYRQKQEEERELAEATEAAHILVSMSRATEPSTDPTRPDESKRIILPLRIRQVGGSELMIE